MVRLWPAFTCDTGRRRIWRWPRRENVSAGTIVYEEPDGERMEVPVTGGNVKMQWKPDWAMRWAALGVDFEMYGKDHSTNTPIYDRICEILGVPAPEHFVYELFLDDQGQKISKS